MGFWSRIVHGLVKKTSNYKAIATQKRFPHLGIRLSYRGKSFSGFQWQKNAPSIQAEVERTLGILFRRNIRISFTSRTDAGVNAYDQWIFVRNGLRLFRKLSKLQQKKFLISFNAISSKEIMAWQLLRLSSKFQPKENIKWKEYEYRILVSPFEDPLSKDYTWWIRGPLNLKIIRQSAKLLTGEHDFTGFAKSSRASGRSGVRKIIALRILIQKHPILARTYFLIFRFRATGFLHHMARNITGTLIDLGLGKRHDLSEILRVKDRKLSGRNAPPHALSLFRTYVEDRFFQVLG